MVDRFPFRRLITAPFFLYVAAFALGGVACRDAFTGPITAPTPVGATADAARMQALACSVDVRAHTLTCADAAPTARAVPHDATPHDATPHDATAPTAGGPQRTLVIGHQGVYVRLFGSAATPTSVHPDTLTVPVGVQNLLGQPLGTTDGVTYDGRGVIVFFSQAPTVTGGSGVVSVLNADLTGTFTASGQQAFVYPQFLAGNQSTPERSWQFLVPPSVATFQFVVLVSAQLQDESSPLSAQPAHVFAAHAAAGIVGGAHTTCALRPGAGVYCWGTAFGAVQDSVSRVPLLVPGSGTAVSLAVSTTAMHACWLTASGSAACVGDNSDGQLGDGGTTPATTARAVQTSGGMTFTRLAVGVSFTCGLTPAGAAYCWGYNAIGQLGNASFANTGTVTAVYMPVGVRFTEIGSGLGHSCALTAAGAAYCWGYNGLGQLGTGSGTVEDSVPQPVQMPAGVTFTQIAGGGTSTCALASGGAAYCWGANSAGQLGDSTQTDRATPVRVHLPAGVTLTQIAVGLNHACGRATDGTAYCWGDNNLGQLGDNSGGSQSTPVPVVLVPTGVTFAQLSAGGQHTCGITPAGAAYCWGDNGYGQIGDGTGGQDVIRPTPVAVHMP